MIDPLPGSGEAAARLNEDGFQVGKRINPGVSVAGETAPVQAWAGLATLWCGQLGDLATLCAGSFAEEDAERLLALRQLLEDAPDPELIRGLVVPARLELEALVCLGAGVAAALAIIGPDSGYLLSRGASGLHAASVYLPDPADPDGATEVTAIGESAVLALAGAIAQALVDRQARRALVTLS